MAAQQAQNKNEVLDEDLEMSQLQDAEDFADSQDDGKDLADPDELRQDSKKAAADLANVEAQLKLL